MIEVQLSGRVVSASRIKLTSTCEGRTRHWTLRYLRRDVGYPHGFGHTNPNTPLTSSTYQPGRYAGDGVAFELQVGGLGASISRFTTPDVPLNCPGVTYRGGQYVVDEKGHRDGSFHLPRSRVRPAARRPR